MTNKKKLYASLLFLIILLVGFFAYKAIRSTDCLKVNTFESGPGWGYEISCNEQVFIHQAIVPGISGNYCFRDESDARKVGKLVLKKIRDKKIPSISEKEMKDLEIEYLEINKTN